MTRRRAHRKHPARTWRHLLDAVLLMVALAFALIFTALQPAGATMLGHIRW